MQERKRKTLHNSAENRFFNHLVLRISCKCLEGGLYLEGAYQRKRQRHRKKEREKEIERLGVGEREEAEKKSTGRRR